MFDPWVRKIPWRRGWPLTPVFLPGEFHGQRNLADCGSWGQKEWDTTEPLTLSPSGSLSQCLENLFYPPPRLVRLSEEPWEQTSLTAFPPTVSQSLSVWDC